MIRDETIRGYDSHSYSITSHSNQPSFSSVPELIDHYANPGQRNLPFILNVNNPMYSVMADGLDIYDNAAITNIKVESNDFVPAVPTKRQSVSNPNYSQAHMI